MTLADTRLRRDVQKELVKREIEMRPVFVTVYNGVVYLDGDLQAIRGVQMDLRREREIIEDIVRRMKGVRDVVNNLKTPL